MRRFYAPKENFQGTELFLSEDETRHLRDVLRLRTDETVRIFDGQGREFLCEIERVEKRETFLKIINEIEPAAPESDLELTLAIGVLKGEKFDLIVQKAVELGVSKFIPIVTRRTDVKIKDGKKRTERFRRISLEAAKQSGRAKLMTVEMPTVFEDFIKTAEGKKILFAESGGEKFSQIQETKKITAVIGSEGGWENSEIELARKLGFQIITFGGRIMRAETAAIAVSAILQNRFGDIN